MLRRLTLLGDPDVQPISASSGEPRPVTPREKILRVPPVLAFSAVWYK